MGIRTYLHRATTACVWVRGGHYHPLDWVGERFQLYRWWANSTRLPLAEQQFAVLPSRGVLEVSGPECTNFLQGLVSNDVRLVQEEKRPIFAAMSNPQGRFLYDLLIHPHPSNTDAVFLDVDRAAVDPLLATLRRFKLRAKVKIDDVSDTKRVAVQFHYRGTVPSSAPPRGAIPHCVEDDTQARKSSSSSSSSSFSPILKHVDPRLRALGLRGVIDSGATDTMEARAAETYQCLRASLGIPEGLEEISSGEGIPLEFNLDGLNGVSYTKGCYVGQELTARTHYRGVVRKRLMPVLFRCDPSECTSAITPGAKITISSKEESGESGSRGGGISLGRVAMVCSHASGHVDDTVGTPQLVRQGLALLRLEHALPRALRQDVAGDVHRVITSLYGVSTDHGPPMMISGTGVSVQPILPFWWPQEWGPVALGQQQQ